MDPFYREHELIYPITCFLQEKGFHVRQEIQIGFCRADLVGFKHNCVIAVELKLQNWKKAVIQTKNYVLGADYVYIAVPLMRSYTILRKAETLLKKEGIGLLTVNEKTCAVHVLIEAKKQYRTFGRIQIPQQKKKFKKRF